MYSLKMSMYNNRGNWQMCDLPRVSRCEVSGLIGRYETQSHLI